MGWNGGQGGWNDATGDTYPDWVEVAFAGERTIDEVDVFTVQDAITNPSEPTAGMTFALYGLTAYDVQYWTGTAWATVPNGAVTGNNKVWRKLSFPAVTTTKVRVVINGALASYSRLVEVEAWGGEGAAAGAGTDIQWLVSDQLGTPRMVVDQTGSLSGMTRHDYLPFGEELSANVGGRTATQGYGAADGVRQQFTGYERDEETGLDFAQARYYSAVQGRFASVDPFPGSATTPNPKTWNRYVYSLNNPLRYIDPTGMTPQDGITINNPCAMGEAGCRPVDMGTVTVTETSASPVSEAVATVAEVLFQVVQGIPAGAAGALSFGTVGGARPTDTLPNRVGQAIGDAAVGVLSYDAAAGGTGVTVASGGTAAVVSVPVAAAGAVGVVGAAVNGLKIITTPMQMSGSTLEPGDHAGESIPARGPGRDFTRDERDAINNIGRETGCHTCGSTDPGTKSGDFVLDHQPPTQLVPPDTPQQLYPQCIGCSRKQGGEVTTELRRRSSQ